MNKTTPQKPRFVLPHGFIAWLEEDSGRAAYFSKVDPGLYQATISKMKNGIIPITFEYAIRLERAQKASPNPLKAEQLMTFLEHRELYRYVTGQEPAPAQLEIVRKKPERIQQLTQAGQHHAAA